MMLHRAIAKANGKLYPNFQMVPSSMILSVMYNVLSGLAACGRLGVAARPACLFGTRPVARDQRHASHVGATPAD